MADKILGWIGTGVMGHSMCRHLLDAGYTVHVFNRSREKAEDLIQAGAHWQESPGEIARNSSVIFTIVGYPSDVEEVYFGRNGVLENAGKGSILVDMTTSEPELARRIATEAEDRELSSLDAPVSGGDIGAREGKLAIMAGGEEKAFTEILPLFQHMGENISYMGSAGSGQHTKMSNQILIASTMVGVVESLLYAYTAGLSMDKVIDVIGKGAASSWSINTLGRRIAKGDFSPGFYIKHFVKDMGIALSEASRMRLSLPGLALAHQFYISAMAVGLEDLGTQGLYKVFQRMNVK